MSNTMRASTVFTIGLLVLGVWLESPHVIKFVQDEKG